MVTCKIKDRCTKVNSARCVHSLKGKGLDLLECISFKKRKSFAIGKSEAIWYKKALSLFFYFFILNIFGQWAVAAIPFPMIEPNKFMIACLFLFNSYTCKKYSSVLNVTHFNLRYMILYIIYYSLELSVLLTIHHVGVYNFLFYINDY